MFFNKNTKTIYTTLQRQSKEAEETVVQVRTIKKLREKQRKRGVQVGIIKYKINVSYINAITPPQVGA